MSFSDFIVYVDESGDHGLRSINLQYPVFVLTFCVCRKLLYQETVSLPFQRLKFDFWGHDAVILHSHEIRKSRGDFGILFDAAVREQFIDRINRVMLEAEFTVIAAVIDKQRLVDRYLYPGDPYSMALGFCMERLQMFLTEERQVNRTTHLLVECRGKAEDDKLELEFRRIRDGANRVGRMDNLAIRFVDKKHNSAGLQLADLVAYPIGRHSVRPDQPNRAYEIVERKFRQSPRGRVTGYGLKEFP
jgi:hypothetical protein